ncbi:MAG: mechanosensitive ion channel family protein [Planctomycetota bacterium]|jgi:small conductance mechanosensitive channel
MSASSSRLHQRRAVAAGLPSILALAFAACLLLTPAARAQDAGESAPATPVAPAPAAITTVDEALAAVGSTDSDVAVLRRAVRPLFKAQLEEALPVWLEHVQQLTAAGERATPAIERAQVILDAIAARGGDVTEAQAYLKAAGGTIVADVDPTDVGGLARRIEAWVVSPDGGVKLGTNILLFLVILLAAKIVASIVSGVIRRMLSKVNKGSELLRDFLANITGQTIFIIGLVVALGRLGINTGPLLAAIGAAGFVIGFALQGTLSNFAAGVMILLYRPYDIGDVVTAGGVTGKVQAMTLVSTTLVTGDNQVIIVPNGSIWGSTITNVTGNDTRRVDMSFGIGYSDDIDQAERVLTEIVTSHPKVLAEPAPVVKLNQLADSSVNFVVRPWARTSDYWDVLFDVHREVKKRFDAEGIGIPFPQMDVHVHQAG